MITRILTATPLVLLCIGALFWSQPWGVIAMCLFFFIWGAWEYFQMLRAAGHQPLVPEGLLLTLAFLIASYWTQFDGLDVLIAVGLIVILISTLFRRIPAEKVLVCAAGTLFGALYAGYLGGYIIRLKMQGGEWGKDLLLMLFFLVWAGDSFALWAGKLFGKTPLAPSASPKKTWEGAAGGAFGSFLFAVILKFTAVHSLTWTDVIICTVLITIIGILGDLCESLLKRSSGLKDSGGLLPGHGGVLDRVDSMLFAAPALYYYYHFIIANRGTDFWSTLFSR